MQKLQKACDVIVVVGLIAVIGYWIYGAMAPVKYIYKNHKIASGDTLVAIAQHYGKESTEQDINKIIWDIREANNIDSKMVGNLPVGKEIKIPIQK